MTDPFTAEAEVLEKLEERFLAALRDKDAGRLDEAEEALQEILTAEPRLAEPRMELARVHLDTGRLGSAEIHAREALAQLGQGGQWTEELPEDVLLALCHALLAEILRRHADEDDVIFGDPEEFRRLVAESRTHFEEAARLDPSDEYASYYAFFMGVEDAQATEAPEGSDGSRGPQ